MSGLAKYANNVSTTLSAGASSGDASLSITSATGWPTLVSGQSYHYATLDDGTNREIVRVTARSGTTLTVTRGQQGTTARTWASGSTIEIRWTAEDGKWIVPDDVSEGGGGLEEGELRMERSTSMVLYRTLGSATRRTLLAGPDSPTAVGARAILIWEGGAQQVRAQSSWSIDESSGALYGASGAFLVLPALPGSPDTSEGSTYWDSATQEIVVGNGGSSIRIGAGGGGGGPYLLVDSSAAPYADPVVIETTSDDINIIPGSGTVEIVGGLRVLGDVQGDTVAGDRLLLLDQDGAGAQYLNLRCLENLTVGRVLTIAVSDGDRTLTLSGNLTVSAATTISAFGASLVDDADATAARATLGLALGSQAQAWDADLDALAALSSTGIARRTGSGTWSVGTLVTLAELANLTGPTVIGRTTGTGAPAALTGVEVARVAAPVQTLTDAATITWDVTSGLRAKVTVAGNRTVANPTNLVDGDEIELLVIQDGTGGRTVDFGTSYEKPAVATGANAVTIHRWRYDSALTPALRLVSEPWVTIACTADTSDSTPADTEVTGLRYVGLDGATYLFRWYLEWDSATSTTGLQGRIDGGANGTGSQWMMVQSSSATTPVIRLGPVGAVNVNGVSSTVSTGPNAFVGEARVTVAGGTTNIAMKFQTEIATSTVTVRTPSRVFVRRIA